ncbi:MAG: M23 family metallopeptidase [Actinobacteria bacterium]|nr:M23 family metallopeptidase [Actinomycetota bacterium]
MSSAKLTTAKRVEHAAIGTGVILAAFAAFTWALSADAQAAVPAESTSAVAVPPQAPSLASLGLTELPAPFANVVNEPVPDVVPVPKPEPEPKDPSHLSSGWYTPVAKYSMTARFGVPGGWSSGYHTGLDLATNSGRAIRAATAGRVISADYEGAYGNIVKIRIAPKTEIWMAHMDRVKVKRGDQVTAGQVVGTVGMTGNTSGPHCHFEVRVNGKPKNPENFLWPDSKSVRTLR